MNNDTTLVALFALFLLAALAGNSPSQVRFPTLDDFNVVWDTPSKDALGSMPLGNGDITLNLWVEEGGDLLFYIGKSDAWDEYNRLLKLGKVRISLVPNPFAKGGKFRQELVLRKGEVFIQASQPKSSDIVEVRVWVDANHPVIHITVESEQPLTATASLELWRTKPTMLTSFEVSDIYNACPNPPTVVIEPDTIIQGQPDGIGWFRFNKKSEGPELTMRFQDLLEAPWRDPLIHRVFGAFIRVDGAFEKLDDQRLRSPNKTQHRFSIYVLTEQPSSPERWLSNLRKLIKKIEAMDFEKRRKAHIAWWEAFWNRSWIYIRDKGSTHLEKPVPANSHPLKIGIDQSGGSRFVGEIVRVSILKGALSIQEIRKIHQSDREKNLGLKNVLVSLVNPAIGTDLNIKPEELDAFTCEAWIKVREDDKGGRILDKITPGGSDGFLLDTFPGKSVRLIVGNKTFSAEGVLRPEVWHHIVAVISPQRLQVYLDSEFLFGDKNLPGYDVCLGYILQRFITACAGRGAYPIKFNGSLFVMPWPGYPNDADYRRWGPGYWWQNTRLPYLSACTSGDFDILQPFFRMYAGEVFEVCKYRTRRYFGFEGAYFPECIYPWGAVFMDTYGWEKPAAEREDKLQSSRWHKYEWVGGLELAHMMLDYYEHTLDERFLKEKVIPLAYEVLKFFDNFYRTGPDGKLVMEPSQALETWWDCRNPMPEVAGLHAVTSRLLALSDKLPPKVKAFVESFRKKIPPLPTRELNGTKMLAPAERFATKMNVENPELYAVFPFRLVSFEKPNAELGINALKHRLDRGNFGWRQDEIFMAYLGLAREAKEYLVGRARSKNPLCRFPAFWGHNYDWTPDQDHGGVLMKALQAMLMQTEGRKIFLFPAWVKEWDVHFKLHAPYRTVIEGKLVNGKLVELKVTPKERMKDIVVLEPK
ncbi:MAG: DUF5703 domain-containing protein [Armatimonadota bacterium]|nr:DUF5703 domain-containing protein [Armatimonadota bacterium]MDW8143026.1 DUF5703 domain-containing protein [Armatimonadota bacterium]